MMVRTCIKIYEQDRQFCREKNLLLSYVFKAGINALKKEPETIEMTKKIQKLADLYEKSVGKIAEMEEKMKNFGGVL